MNLPEKLRKDLVKTVILTLLTLFLIPAIALVLVQYGQSKIDQVILQSIERGLEKDTRLSPALQQQAKSHFRANPASSTCNNSDPDIAKYREKACPTYSDLWQFNIVGKTSFWTIIGGALLLVTALALGAIAFINRRAQYLSFILGWHLLTLTSTVEVLVQGSLAIWLSFWIPAILFKMYSIKLILVVGFFVLIAMFIAIVTIFKKPPQTNAVSGELVSAADAPNLWARIRDLAARQATAPPQQIIAGINSNFFVTETPLTVGGKKLHGRSLFISLPLLRVLDQAEADAVFAHELAHLSGGDAASSAKLGPKLVQYDQYCQKMGLSGLMHFYRIIFEFALQRESREREFSADRVAATAVSPSALIQALIKVAAYARYRAEIEMKLFQNNHRLDDNLCIAEHIAAGLQPYANSGAFASEMASAGIPHPFDSHPPLRERMKNIGHEIGETLYSQIVAQTPTKTWTDEIQTASAIEQNLWAEYERQFASIHEQDLAYRYEPANDVEKAVVLSHFPSISFPLKGKEIIVSYRGLSMPELLNISWDNVSNLRYEDAFGSDILTIEHSGKGWLGNRSTKVKLPGIRKNRALFKATLGRYWQRHQIMRQRIKAGENPH